jgi:hypothetical protein
MQGIKAGAVRAACVATIMIVAACSNKSPAESAPQSGSEATTQNAAIDRQIPALCQKVVETRLACLKSKQAVDRMAGNSADLLSDGVQITQAEQARTVTLHNAMLLQGAAATEQQCKLWASREVEDLSARQIPQIRAKGGDAGPCERAVEALGSTSASTTTAPSVMAGAGQPGALTPEECDRLVRRSLFNMSFTPNDPLKAKFVATCVAGREHYTRDYFNCVFAAKYADALECDYAERGIDRSKSAPELAVRQAGDDGSFESSASMVIEAIYKGNDPHTTIDQITRNQYLSKRDNILRSLGEPLPADGHLPLRSSNSKTTANGLTYWVVHEDFQDLQLAKIEFDDPSGSNSVICARYGSTESLTTREAFCSALVKKYLHTEIIE